MTVGVNLCTFIGNLGRDPETKYTAAGLAVASFSIAVTEKFKGEERTEWVKVVAFGKLAEICGQYLAKGSQIYIQGRMQTNEWTDKDGNRRWTTEIIADQMRMLGSNKNATGGSTSQNSGHNQQNQYQSQWQGQQGQNQAPANHDDDIPF